jgi:predicted RND superfamily exporter protein
MLMTPFVSNDLTQSRFTMRIIESDKKLERAALLKRIQNLLQSKMGLADDQIRFTNMYVLYNNMLQSLFRSQILTIGIVFLAIMVMFVVLFRSLRLAFIAIIPNLLPAAMVLGFMGWLNIPLNMMTITIASITIGIAVDDTIHYIHRFQKEFPKDRNYLATVYRCHRSIGRAMYYTSITIIIGFSILVVSNFIPTIYFGLSTGFAMLVALLAALTLLPQLLIILKPLGPEDGKKES